MNFVATVYTRLFQFVAVPTILLAVITTLTMFGRQKDTGRIFRHAVTYTLLTTIVAAAVGLVLYNLIRPGNLPAELIHSGSSAIPADLGKETYYDHILSVIPDNVVRPLLEGNVLSLLLIAFAVGFALSKMPETENKKVVVKLSAASSGRCPWVSSPLPPSCRRRSRQVSPPPRSAVMWLSSSGATSSSFSSSSRSSSWRAGSTPSAP